MRKWASQKKNIFYCFNYVVYYLLDYLYLITQIWAQWREILLKTPKAHPHKIIIQLRGVVELAPKIARTKVKCWNLFFIDFILILLVQSTNQYIETLRERC